MAEEDPSAHDSAPDGKPYTRRKDWRMEEILRVIEEYASSQREFLKALRQKYFH
jgi:hypothetical protein